VEPTPAVFFDLTAAVASDTAEVLTGNVSVIDPDEGEAFIVMSTIMGTFGPLSIMEDGSWTYTLDTANEVIAALINGKRETDTIIIETFDGTTAEFVITITGVGVDIGGANNVAVVIDTGPGDTGELRYALGDDGPLAQGEIEVSVKRLDDDLDKAAFLFVS
jgi:VCBS repeat-containing protein